MAEVAKENTREYPEGYEPSADEEFMNDMQKAYFRDILLKWREDLIKESQATVQDLKDNSSIESDPNDQATIEYEQTVELRTRDRERKLVTKIDEALERIKTNDYGYCEETGDPIGIPRLLARPTATLCIEAKRRQEQKETGYAG